MPRKPTKAAIRTHGGQRPNAGRKPVPRICGKCGATCPSAREARAHC